MVPKLREILNRLETALQPYGFEIKSKSLVCPTKNSDVRGVIVLQSKIYRNDCVSIFPIVGVHSERIRRLSTEFFKVDDGPCFLHVHRNLGYLMPEDSARTWNFNGAKQDSKELKSLIQSIVKCGIPFIKSASTLRGMIKNMKLGHSVSRDFSLAFALYLDKKCAEARRFVKSRAESKRNPSIFVGYNVFRNRFERFLRHEETLRGRGSPLDV